MALADLAGRMRKVFGQLQRMGVFTELLDRFHKQVPWCNWPDGLSIDTNTYDVTMVSEAQ